MDGEIRLRFNMQLKEAQVEKTLRNVVAVQYDDVREQLIGAGLTPAEIDELHEWWSYTKPIGPSVKIRIKHGAHPDLGLTTTGTELGPARPAIERLPSELFIG
jgi:hypothetical protein